MATMLSVTPPRDLQKKLPPSPARLEPREEKLRLPLSPLRLEPREEKLRLPQGSPTKTGLRKRGQTSSRHEKSTSASSVDQLEGLLHPHYTRSLVSVRSDMTLGILDLYLRDSDEPHLDPSIQAFDFDLPKPHDDRAILPSYRPNFFRKAMPRLTTPKRLINVHRRRSSLSICCQGEMQEPFLSSEPSDDPPELSFSCHTAESSPIEQTSWHRRNSETSSGSPIRTSKAVSARNKVGSVQSIDQHECQTIHSASSTSFDFVHSLRRRPIPLREAPPSMRSHKTGFLHLKQTITSRLRRLFKS